MTFISSSEVKNVYFMSGEGIKAIVLPILVDHIFNYDSTVVGGCLFCYPLSSNYKEEQKFLETTKDSLILIVCLS